MEFKERPKRGAVERTGTALDVWIDPLQRRRGDHQQACLREE